METIVPLLLISAFVVSTKADLQLDLSQDENILANGTEQVTVLCSLSNEDAGLLRKRRQFMPWGCEMKRECSNTYNGQECISRRVCPGDVPEYPPYGPIRPYNPPYEPFQPYNPQYEPFQPYNQPFNPGYGGNKQYQPYGGGFSARSNLGPDSGMESGSEDYPDYSDPTVSGRSPDASQSDGGMDQQSSDYGDGQQGDGLSSRSFFNPFLRRRMLMRGIGMGMGMRRLALGMRFRRLGMGMRLRRLGMMGMPFRRFGFFPRPLLFARSGLNQPGMMGRQGGMSAPGFGSTRFNQARPRTPYGGFRGGPRGQQRPFGPPGFNQPGFSNPRLSKRMILYPERQSQNCIPSEPTCVVKFVCTGFGADRDCSRKRRCTRTRCIPKNPWYPPYDPYGRFGPGQRDGPLFPDQFIPGGYDPYGRYGPGQRDGPLYPYQPFTPDGYDPYGRYGPGQRDGPLYPNQGFISGGYDPYGRYGPGQAGGYSCMKCTQVGGYDPYSGYGSGPAGGQMYPYSGGGAMGSLYSRSSPTKGAPTNSGPANSPRMSPPSNGPQMGSPPKSNSLLGRSNLGPSFSLDQDSSEDLSGVRVEAIRIESSSGGSYLHQGSADKPAGSYSFGEDVDVLADVGGDGGAGAYMRVTINNPDPDVKASSYQCVMEVVDENGNTFEVEKTS